MKIKCLDKYGYPVETIGGQWFKNLIRRLIFTRNIDISGGTSSIEEAKGL